MTRRFGLKALLAALLTGLSAPALAHPHITVMATAEIVYEPGGKVMGIRHVWAFDQFYSAYITQGLDTDGNGTITSEEMKDLAKENTESLVEFDYFTVLKANGKKQDFGAPKDYSMSYANEMVTLTYLLPLKSATDAKTLSFEVYDPSFFVAFTVADEEGSVKTVNAPEGCKVNVFSDYKPADPSQSGGMADGPFRNPASDAMPTTQLSSKAIIACP